MSRFLSKLGFVHRRLWHRDGTYRAAILVGPPPLIGAALAAALWALVHAAGAPPAVAVAPPAWAVPDRPRPAADPVSVEEPSMPLPATGADGVTAGWRAGWVGRIAPIEVGPTLDVDVLPKTIATFEADRPDVDIGPILAAGPPDRLFVGLQTAMLAVRAEGIYGVSLRLDRSSPQIANCLVRLGFTNRRLISSLEVGVAGVATRNFDPTNLNLRPGLYRIAVVFGCWHNHDVLGPGHVTVLIRRPGEAALTPAEPDEVLRPLTP